MTLEREQVCPLCLRVGVLQMSHVIPAFMVRNQRTLSVTGRFVSGEDQRTYLQDGPKLKMLCYNCEQLLQKLEDVSAREVWRPFIRNPNARVPYGSEFYRMCVAITWRAIQYCRMQRSVGLEWDYPAEIWRTYLNNERSDCNGLNHHLLFFPEYTVDSLLPLRIPYRLNQYLTQGFDIKLSDFSGIPVVTTKIGNIMIVGIGAVDQSETPWINHLLSVCGGIIGIDATISVPLGIWNSVADAADKYAAFAESRTKEERDRARRRGKPEACSELDRLKAIDDAITAKSFENKK